VAGHCARAERGSGVARRTWDATQNF
jgi:hypothetical protein